jgi:PST family polysaccharide transporter
MITSLAWVAVLQGRGQAKEIARAQIQSGGLSLLLSVGLVYCFGITGVIASLVLVPALSCVMLYARDLQPARQVEQQDGIQGILLKAGLALVGSIAVTQLALHATRIIIVQSAGLDRVGYYQAALGIAGNIPAFIFTAMAVDYYPRIASASDQEEVLLLTNRQIQAGALLATPIFAGLILWGGPLLHLLYSAEFRPAEGIQGWMIWGVACRLVSWPIGYWLLAKAPAREIFIIESAGALTGPILTFFSLRLFGFSGVGVAYLAQAMLYGIMVLCVMRRKTGQGISSASKKAAGLAFVALGLAQLLVLMEAPAAARALLTAGMAAVAGFIYYRKSVGHA